MLAAIFHYMSENKYTKKRLKIFQNGISIFDRDVWICLEDTNTYPSPFYYHRDRNMRRVKYKNAADDPNECYIMLGVGDTLIVCEPSCNM